MKSISPLRFFRGLLNITPLKKEWVEEFNAKWLKGHLDRRWN